MANPTKKGEKRLEQMARSLAGARDVQLTLIPEKVNREADLQVYVDRRPTSGGILFYQGCAVASWSKRQACVALSSAESELGALASGSVEALGFTTMLSEWGEKTVPTLYSDSSSALHVVKKRRTGEDEAHRAPVPGAAAAPPVRAPAPGRRRLHCGGCAPPVPPRRLPDPVSCGLG